MNPSTRDKLNLQYTERNLIKIIEDKNMLNGGERAVLKEAVDEELRRYQEIADDRFDSNKNWSIMIKDQCNDERNRIMRKFKFRQFKKHKLHEFLR